MQVEHKQNYDIKNKTSFKVGGIVSDVYFPTTQQELVYLLRELPSYIVLGNCSNVLISSEGYEGNIILTTNLKEYQIRGTKVYASCGVKGQFLAQRTCFASLSGFEFMIGFPGTIGGEIYMNASAHGQSISDTLITVCLYDKKERQIVYKQKSEMNFRYRSSILKEDRYIVLGAEFELKRSGKEYIDELILRNLNFRKMVQPNLARPNAGSVFKNPQNDSAGRLLDKAGVKKYDFEHVQVWQNHANFIVNKGNATSYEILELMYKMYKDVENAYTVKLEPEVIYIGNKSKKEEEICKILYKKNQK